MSSNKQSGSVRGDVGVFDSLGPLRSLSMSQLLVRMHRKPAVRHKKKSRSSK